MNFNNNILNRNNIIIFFFVFLIINYLFFNYRILSRENGYILGDWVINYSAGFVKRGFLGHFFYTISKNFNISIINIVFLFSSSIYILSLYFFYKIIKKHLENNIIFIFIFLPSTFLFNFFDPLSVGRKEILVFFFFYFYYFNLDRINNYLKFKIFTYFLFITIALTHELIIFFIPYLFVIKYFNFNNKSENKIKNYFLELLILISGILLLIIIFKFNHLHNNDLLCKSLEKINLTNKTCWAINDFKNQISINFLLNYFLEKNYFLNYLIYFILSIIPIVLLTVKSNSKIKKKFILFSLFCLIFSVSFFIQVNDWGRYLNVVFFLQFLLVLKFIENEDFFYNKNIFFFKPLQLILIFFYLTSWNMPHCCNPELGKGYINIYERIKFRIIDNSNESTKYNDVPRKFLRKIFKID